MAGYGSDEQFAAWAAAAGYTIPEGSVTAARQRGSDYVDGAYGARFPGTPTGGIEQERAWPRTGASAAGSAIGSDVIPARVVNASYQAALLELNAPGSLSVVADPSKRVRRQKVEGIEREFFEPGTDGPVTGPVSTAIEGLLAPLLIPANAPAIMVV
ncbi:hypothetical protein NGM99_13775 [Mesorhizobium sp. RP14(2022)]|uniref:Putative DnaT-like domain-containing protein n=1 Tax=Mesorhizobium liriopis TaxID=2953882 RepID=A0ABT1C855_9HYPH|nr:DnaT-like ssDNA-binding protein [Mesorhizobium liriopis]MCO6050848.1 hypothetical protein [Mesorhizobium liriopis]